MRIGEDAEWILWRKRIDELCNSWEIRCSVVPLLNVELGKALEQFLQRKQHLMMAVDEYGGIEGLITMEDVVEAILGVEIVDEADRIVDLRALAKQRRDKRVAEVKAMGESDEEQNLPTIE